MLASEWLPPFPGGLSDPTGFLQRISTSGYPIVSFLSGLVLTLYAGFELELAGAERYGPSCSQGEKGPVTAADVERYRAALSYFMHPGTLRI